MKIAVFHNLPEGGALRVVGEQVKRLSKNHEVKVYTLCLELKGNRIERDFDNFYTLRFRHKNLARLIDSGKYDVVLVHHDKLTQAPFLLRYLKTPSVYYCEEWLRIVYEKQLRFRKKIGIHKVVYEYLTRQIRKQIDHKNTISAGKIIANSKFTARNIKKAYRKNAVICHPGVDTSIFKKQKVKKKRQLLFVGEPNEINGHNLFLEIARTSGCRPEVVHGHKLTDRQLAEKYSESLATLCLAYNEPFGLVPLESMACETPVLAVNEGGYKETIIDGKTGYLLPRSVERFVEKIKALPSGMGIQGRKHILTNFSWVKHCEILLQELLLTK